MKTEWLSKKEFRRRRGSNVLGWHYTTEEGEHVVELPRGASTRTRLHEIAHSALEHKGGPESYDEWFGRELGVAEYISEKRGEDLPWSRILGGSVDTIIEELLEKGYGVSSVFNLIKEEMEDAGYSMDREDRSILWWHIKDYRDFLRRNM